MGKLKSDSALMVYYEVVVFTEAALEAYEPVAALAAPVTLLLGSFEALYGAQLAMVRTTQKLGARVRVGNMRLKEALRELQRDVLGEVRQDRAAPAYELLFKENIAQTVRYGLDEQIKVAELMRGTLVASSDRYTAALVERHEAALGALIGRGEALVDERRTHEARVSGLRLEVKAWKEEASVALRVVEGELTTFAAKNRQTRAWVRMFFK